MGAPSSGDVTMVAEIPIRNLYYLLCYSWDQLEQGELIDVSNCPTTALVDLFALVLCSGTNHLLRRGLEQGYEPRFSELSSPRGRIDSLGTARRFLNVHGRAACHHDELLVNTLANRILKRTLETLRSSSELSPTLRSTVASTCKCLQGIEDINITADLFRRVQLHGNNRFYRFLLNACELTFRCALPDERSGVVRFRDFIRDERAMARVFERFLFNFLRREFPAASVKRERIAWSATSQTDPRLTLLPGMHTDISIYESSCRLIIDAKYYRSSLSSYMDSTKFHSANLYQLMSYLTNAAQDAGGEVRGMLVYPRVDRTLRESYTVLGHHVTVSTVDLSADWPHIRDEICSLVGTALQPSSVHEGVSAPSMVA
jgi:5-methylcytosine-specific restriction enzyme subunit McrC